LPSSNPPSPGGLAAFGSRIGLGLLESCDLDLPVSSKNARPRGTLKRGDVSACESQNGTVTGFKRLAHARTQELTNYIDPIGRSCRQGSSALMRNRRLASHPCYNDITASVRFCQSCRDLSIRSSPSRLSSLVPLTHSSGFLSSLGIADTHLPCVSHRIS